MKPFGVLFVLDLLCGFCCNSQGQVLTLAQNCDGTKPRRIPSGETIKRQRICKSRTTDSYAIPFLSPRERRSRAPCPRPKTTTTTATTNQFPLGLCFDFEKSSVLHFSAKSPTHALFEKHTCCRRALSVCTEFQRQRKLGSWPVKEHSMRHSLRAKSE